MLAQDLFKRNQRAFSFIPQPDDDIRLVFPDPIRVREQFALLRGQVRSGGRDVFALLFPGPLRRYWLDVAPPANHSAGHPANVTNWQKKPLYGRKVRPILHRNVVRRITNRNGVDDREGRGIHYGDGIAVTVGNIKKAVVGRQRKSCRALKARARCAVLEPASCAAIDDRHEAFEIRYIYPSSVRRDDDTRRRADGATN
jgi:hypothetical protein